MERENKRDREGSIHLIFSLYLYLYYSLFLFSLIAPLSYSHSFFLSLSLSLSISPHHNLFRWITYSDEEAPSSPCFFCFDCFYCLHYTESLEKQHEFFAYVYLENCEDRIGYQVALEKHKQNRKMLIDK